MTVRLRVIFFISAIFALLAGSLFIVFNTILLRGFLQIEDEGAHRNAARVVEAVNALQEEVAVKAEEWGTWDDSYSYIKKRQPQYESSNLTYDALNQLSLRHFLMTDLKAKIIKGLFVDIENEKIAPLDKETTEVLLKVSAITLEKKTKTAGIVEIHGETFIVGAAPVTNSAGDAPINGVVLFSRNFDSNAIERIAEQTKTALVIDKIDDLRKDARYGKALDKAVQSGKDKTSLTADEIFGVDVIRDVFDQPVRAAVVTMKRDLLVRGIQARNVVITYVLGFTLIALIFSLFLLNRILLSPLHSIGQQTKLIGYGKESPGRIEPVGDAEIQELSANINRMLDSLATAHAEVTKARNQAEEANFAKSTFIARVSHELRNPMHGIRGINHLILKRESSKAVRDLVNMGDLAAESLLSIVDEILDFSKAEAGELTFEKIAYDPRQVLRETMQVAAARLEGKYRSGETERVQFICEADPAIPRLLEGDPTRIKQILVNLLTNAVKFTERGFVGVRLEAAERAGADLQLKIKVWDTGIGIPQQKIGSLFTPFKQADETIARKYQGTGLGLSIVKQFVEGMGGAVRVTSEEGKGSRFEVTLPQRISGDPASAAELLKRSGPLPKQAVLVADPGRPADALAESLAALGVEPELIDPADWDATHAAQFNSADLAIVSEEALYTRSVAEAFTARIKTASAGRTLALLKPSSLELREKLYSLGMKSIFTMPVLADDLLFAFNAVPVESAEAEVTKAIESVRKLRVIIADDAPTNRIILQEMLEDCGHEVVPVSDGKEIIGLVEPMLSGEAGAEQFDLIITDVSMSIMNGDEAAQIIRKLESKIPNGGHLPIIAVTGQAFEGEREQMRSAGIDGILTKPMHPRQLEAELERLFGAK